MSDNDFQRIRTVVNNITGDSEISIILNQNGGNNHTAYYNYENKNLVINEDEIPTEVKKDEKIKNRMKIGLAIHEAGHNKWTKFENIREYLLENNESIMKQIMNIVNDKIVNSNIKVNYNETYKNQLEFTQKVMGESMLETIEKEFDNLTYKKIKNNTEKKVGMIINITSMEGLYNIYLPQEKREMLYDDMIETIEKCEKYLEEATCATDKKTFSNVSKKIYQEIIKYVEENTNKNEQNFDKGNIEKEIPKQIGGKKELKGKKVKKELEKKEKEKKEEGEEEEDSEGEKSGKNDDKNPKDNGGIGVGSGSGLKTPATRFNHKNYEERYQKNIETIKEFLDKLKKMRSKELRIQKRQKHGRFMSERVNNFYVNSHRKNIDRVNEQRKEVITEKKPYMGLVVDLSGSMDIEKAKNALTIISGASSQWLEDKQLSVEVFGANYKRIKAFVEKNDKMKGRIGGLEVSSYSDKEYVLDSGGTEVNPPLITMQKMFNSLNLERQEEEKILVLVSDFKFHTPSETKEIVQKCIEDGIKVIGIGINCSENMINKVIDEDQNMVINDLSELPDKFFEIYKNITEVSQRF